MKTIHIMMGYNESDIQSYINEHLDDHSKYITLTDYHDNSVNQLKIENILKQFDDVFITGDVYTIQQRMQIYNAFHDSCWIENVYFIKPVGHIRNKGYMHYEPPIVNVDCHTARIISEPYYKPFSSKNVNELMDLYQYIENVDFSEELLMNFNIGNEYEINRFMEYATHLNSKVYKIIGIFRFLGRGIAYNISKSTKEYEKISVQYILNYLCVAHDIKYNEQLSKIVGAVFFYEHMDLLKEISKTNDNVDSIIDMIKELDNYESFEH